MCRGWYPVCPVLSFGIQKPLLVSVLTVLHLVTDLQKYYYRRSHTLPSDKWSHALWRKWVIKRIDLGIFYEEFLQILTIRNTFSFYETLVKFEYKLFLSNSFKIYSSMPTSEPTLVYHPSQASPSLRSSRPLRAARNAPT
jgi:hypothetical protein